MRWTERQRAMLREMGIGPWQREEADADVDVAVAATTVAAAIVAPPAPRAPEARPAPRSVVPPRAATPGSDARAAGGEQAHLPEADWLVVGESAAADSAAAEAQLLANLLRAIGVAQDAPARSGRAAVLALGEGDTDKARLQAAVSRVQPKCILAFGRLAARALLDSEEPLGALRSAAHRVGGVPVVVTCSLAFLLRHADEKARVWAELCRAVHAFDLAGAAAG